ncbi:MAG TPA: hypothetical protein VNL36_00525 [Bacteroidota bacterium]|nr:hypothetical protein [Bacteroidota bacterium]
MTSSSIERSAGLCADCVHARAIHNPRGSVFVLCELSFTDPQFAKYPRLPVLSCEGFVNNRPQEANPHSSS